jgi:hypothetical protein
VGRSGEQMFLDGVRTPNCPYTKTSLCQNVTTAHSPRPKREVFLTVCDFLISTVLLFVIVSNKTSFLSFPILLSVIAQTVQSWHGLEWEHYNIMLQYMYVTEMETWCVRSFSYTLATGIESSVVMTVVVVVVVVVVVLVIVTVIIVVVVVVVVVIVVE